MGFCALLHEPWTCFWELKKVDISPNHVSFSFEDNGWRWLLFFFFAHELILLEIQIDLS